MPHRVRDLPFRQLIDSAPDGVIVCDQAGTIVLVNAETERIFAYDRDELLGQSIERLIPERARGQHAHYVARYGDAPRHRPMGIGMELTGLRRDGSEVPIEISLAPINTEHGLMVTAGIRDVTERRQLERENRRANAYLVSAIDAVQEAFALFDEHDRVIMVNSTARQLLAPLDGAIIGLTFEELLVRSLAAGVFDFSSESRDALYARWVAHHREPAGVLEVRTGTGRYLRVHESKTAEQGTVTTIADVTNDVLREEQLRAAREAAETASAAKSEFLASMSHELRTPLNAVLGFAQLLERDKKRPLDERQQERLSHVLRGGEHLLRLIDDVLDLSRIEAGGIAVSCEPVDPVAVIDEVMTALEPLATRSGITLRRARFNGPISEVQADRTRLVQILMNFGSNAIKYGRPGGWVELAIRAYDAAVRISVIDDGIGIPLDKQAIIFEPFQRAGQETGPIEGTGIGLTIAQRLALLMRGRVGFESTADVGSTFWVEVPRCASEREGASAPAPRAPGAALASGNHTVIYIEDNPANIAFMRCLLEELTSVKLITAPTAELGLELVRAHLPDLVILDINLPGMSGFEAMRQLEQWPETRAIPVVGLSAAALAKDTARATGAGFYRYLTKPVKVGELLGVLEDVLVRRDVASRSTTSASEIAEKSR